MKKITKNITIIALLLAAMLVVGAGQVSARHMLSQGSFHGLVAYGGSTSPTTTRYPCKKQTGGIISQSYTMPDVYYVGVPTPVKVTFRYCAKNVGLFGSYKHGKKYRYSKVYGKTKFRIWSLQFLTRQSTGLAQMDADLGDALEQKFKRGKTLSIRPNKTRTVTFWVTYKTCYAWPDPSLPGPQWNIPRSDYLNRLFGFTTPPAGYPCVWAPSMTIVWRGKISRGRFSTEVGSSGMSLYRIPLIPKADTVITPVDPPPQQVTEPVTGPTGEPTGPTGPTE